ncbi:MAG: XdhC family protein [Gammaproteobacteria bacterium]|nr:XdhC family protein [Gammaproteobacteria bacterium]
MSSKALLQRFATWRSTQQTLALATVIETAGSTYSKAGHRILISESGDYQGLVSGGCLEGDLAAHARKVMSTGIATCVTYDMRDEADELFGLGVGCNGLLRILLQSLSPVDDYQPFTAISEVLLGTETGLCGVLVENPADPGLAGKSLVLTPSHMQHTGLSPALTGALTSLCMTAGRTAALHRFTHDGHTLQALLAPLHPVPRLLVLGAGLDAIPLVTLADTLGWRVSVADHRPAYLAREGFGAAEHTLCAPAAELAQRLPLETFSAVVVMSHHLATDRTYLQQLADSGIPYIGLLGPQARRERLLQDLGAAAQALQGRLHGPAGLDIGADSPETIALSILAQIQAVSPPAAELRSSTS